MEDIERTPRGRWEKIAYWASFGTLVPTLIVSEILEGLGLSWWERIGVILLIILVSTYLLSRPAQAERQRRLAADLERGVIDCAIRFPRSAPGSLRDLWEPGVGQLHDQSLHFQTRLGDREGSPAGKKKTFPHAVLAPDVHERPATKSLALEHRHWQTLDLQTTSGLLQVAASKASCEFLERTLGSAAHPLEGDQRD